MSLMQFKHLQEYYNDLLLHSVQEEDCDRAIGIVQDCIELGADVDTVDRKGLTPLHWAAIRGHTAIVQVLIDAHADVNVVNNDCYPMVGWTPLHLAAENCHTETAQVLIRAQANVNAVDKKGETPLVRATVFGRTEMVRVLIAGGANVNVVDRNGDTPLHLATGRIHAEIFQALLDAGANLENLELKIHASTLKAHAGILLPAAAATGNLALVNRLLEIPDFLQKIEKANGQRPYSSAFYSAISAFQTTAANRHDLNKKQLPVDAILGRLLEIKSVRDAIQNETDDLAYVSENLMILCECDEEAPKTSNRPRM